MQVYEVQHEGILFFVKANNPNEAKYLTDKPFHELHARVLQDNETMVVMAADGSQKITVKAIDMRDSPATGVIFQVKIF